MSLNSSFIGMHQLPESGRQEKFARGGGVYSESDGLISSKESWAAFGTGNELAATGLVCSETGNLPFHLRHEHRVAILDP